MRNTLTTTNDIFEDIFKDLNRIAIGFEPTFRRLTDVKNNSSGYPPYDLEQIGDDHYRITLAVAGFTEQDLDIQLTDNQLTISGDIKSSQTHVWLHKSIATRAFTRVFHLADHVKVRGANLENGLLTVDLYREIPEELKPRKIEIQVKNNIIDAT